MTKTKTKHVVISEAVYRRLREYKKASGVAIGHAVEKAIKEMLGDADTIHHNKGDSQYDFALQEPDH